MRFTQGQRVRTPGGLGNVAYERLAAPDYTAAEAVSVVLDSERTRAGYVGTIYRAEAIEPLTREQCPEVLEDPAGGAGWRCTAGKDHIGGHRHGQRMWS